MLNKFYFISLIVCLFLVSCAPPLIINLNPEPIKESSCIPHPQFNSFNVKKIAVLDFQNSDKNLREKFVPHPKFGIQPYDIYVYLQNDDGPFISEIVEKQLLESYKYTIVERRELKKLLEEQKLQLSGLLSKDEAVKIGKLVGVDAILMGRVINAYAHFDVQTRGINGADGFIGTYLANVSIEMRLVHVESGQILWACESNRNSLNYLDKPISVSNLDVIRDTHIFDKHLQGAGPKERIKSILEKGIKEIIRNIF